MDKSKPSLLLRSIPHPFVAWLLICRNTCMFMILSIYIKAAGLRLKIAQKNKLFMSFLWNDGKGKKWENFFELTGFAVLQTQSLPLCLRTILDDLAHSYLRGIPDIHLKFLWEKIPEFQAICLKMHWLQVFFP